MSTMNIERAFQTISQPISAFFGRPGIGYYIPLYQRDYSWDCENIEQLMDDISSGVFELLNNEDNIHFLGTVILVTEDNIDINIQPQDHRALPSRIDNVIDGQQRISTIAILACCLYQKLLKIKNSLKDTSLLNIDELENAIDDYLNKLQEIFSVDINRGNPKRKPLIIRSYVDCWTFDGKVDNHYNSPISYYLGMFIEAVSKNSDFPIINKKLAINDNLKAINDWLDKVEQCHRFNDDSFPSATDIIDKIDESKIWSYQRSNLHKIIKNSDNSSSSEERNKLCSLLQLFAFSYYLLEHCCLTIIQPISQVRAFDMFQSLNATGTPLTAIEVFKPVVINVANKKAEGCQNSNLDTDYRKVESLMKNLRSASSKNKRTNEYLNLFSVTYEGKTLTKQFSIQRKWLISKYDKCSTIDDKEEFIKKMADIAAYCQEIIYSQDNLTKNYLANLDGVSEPERKLACFCLLYLKDANHKMAHTILSRFYALVIRNNFKDVKANNNFVKATQVVAAFFTLWRSALQNTGLDDVYRKLLLEKMSWQKGDENLTLDILKENLKSALKHKGIVSQDEWKNKAINYLRYDLINKVCRFVLFVTSNDTIPDPNEPGLMIIGRNGSTVSYLEPSQWNSVDLKTIEHIAPQNRPDNCDWDQALYQNEAYEQIGNLTLLPIYINSSASNKNWLEKFIYYKHLGEKSPDELNKFAQLAKANGFKLNPSTLKQLEEASFHHHIEPIVAIGETGKWDYTIVQKRTERIHDILWTRLNQWLS